MTGHRKGLKPVLLLAGFCLMVMLISSIVYRIENPSRKVFIEAQQQADHGETPGGPGVPGGMSGMGDPQAMNRVSQMMAQLQESPNDVAVMVEIGRSFLGMQAFDRAESFARRILSVEPENPHGLELLGLATFRLDKPQEAKDAFTELVRVDPANGGAHFNLGVLYRYHLKDEQAALEHFQAAKENATDNPRLLELVEKELAGQ